MLSRIKQADIINITTLAAQGCHWQLRDALDTLAPDEQNRGAYVINLQQLATEQCGMTEWTEHLKEDSPYIIVKGALYSSQRLSK